MHTTALCSPSRSCILTGRNHHSNHMGCLANGSTGFLGYDGYMPFENGMLSEILKERGYNTYCVGKWHLSPEETNTAAGPYDRWPLGRGFERFYGFLGGDTNQWYPELMADNHQVEAEKTPEEGYHLTPDLVEKAKAFIADAKQVAPNKPFFLYFALGAMHSPHHVPQEWADKYKGKFDGGWEVYRKEVFERQKQMGLIPADTELSRPDPDVQDWDKLSADERRLYARMMEVFAGFLEHTDHYIGELIAFLKELGEYENTLIMLISDNGASAEGGPTGSVNECRFFNNVPDTVEDGLKHIDEIGGPTTFNHFAWGWTHAGNTPFRRWKRETYRGGTSDPFILSWPKGIRAKGELRTQYAHIIDMVPTVLDALGIEPPTSLRGVTQAPIEGLSLVSSFEDGGAPARHVTQYFEMLGHRSLYHDGWRAVCPWPGASFTESGRKFGAEITGDLLSELDATGWELYHVAEDFAETQNLAAKERTRLISLISLWYVEAGKYNVLPLDGRGTQRIALERPQIAVNRTRYTLYPGTQAIVAAAAPKTTNRAHSFTAEVVIPGWRRGRRSAEHGRQRRRLRVLRAGWQALLSPQLCGAGLLLRQSGEAPAERRTLREHAVRADRETGHRARQGRAGEGYPPAGRQADRQRGIAAYGPDPARPGRRHGGRCGPGRAGEPGIQATLRIHGNPQTGHRGRERRSRDRP